MILLFPAVLVIAGVLVYRRRDSPGGRGWRWFGAWAAAGCALTFSLLTGLSVGLLIFPLAAALLLLVGARAPHPAESAGFVLGIGAVLLLVAFVNRDYRPCPAGGLTIPAARPGTTASCGGLDPIPWLYSGIVVAAASVVAYAVARRITSR